MATTLTRYLKLKVADDLSADAKYNLKLIDSLGATFVTDSTDLLSIRNKEDILIEPASPDLGGTGNNSGTITLGNVINNAKVVVNSTEFLLNSALSLKNLQLNETNYLNVRYASSAASANDVNFYVDVGNPATDTRSISFLQDGEVVITDATQVLTNKSIDGDSNTLTNIGVPSLKVDGTVPLTALLRDGSGAVVSQKITNDFISNSAAISYSKLALTNSIVNSDIVNGTITDAKLATISTAGKVANSATTATSNNTASTIVARDSSKNFIINNITVEALTASRLVATDTSKALSSVVYGSSNTSNSVVQRDSSGSFAAGTITASLIGNVTGNLTGNVTGNVSGTASNITATTNSTLTSLPSLSLPGTQVSGNISGNAANITGVVAIANGGTGATSKADAQAALLPLYAGNALSTLRVNATEDGIEWAAGAGLGTVTSVGMTVPTEWSVSPSTITSTGTFAISKTSQTANTVYSAPNGTNGVPTFRSLVENDIPTLAQSKITNLVSDLSGKQATITGAATTITSSNLTVSRALVSDASGKVAVSSVTSTQLGYVSGVTSSIQTQLNGKEPSITAGTTAQYWRGDKTWYSPVIDSTAGNETDQAPSVAAMKSYVTATSGGSTSYTWATADGATKSITHSLNKATVSVTVYDENGEDIWVDVIDRTSLNAISLTSSVAPTGNWTVVIRP